uniref:Reverse transcriptase domain-containing protein n=1 Tax=Caenorhabditis japonica TaxID=281687 RepID=A0A8R1DWQ6_CAEJA
MVPTFVDQSGHHATSDHEKAEVLAVNFESQYVNKSNTSFTLPPDYKSDQEIPWVTVAEMLKFIQKCKNSCSDTPDKVPFKFLKLIAPFIASPLSQICNLSMMRGEVPEKWQQSIITPINKIAKPQVPTDFRPISITSQICRIYERFVLSKLLPFLDKIRFWNNNQHGFRPKRSTVSCMLESLNDWTNSIERGSQVDVIYFDYAKAFDRVPHDLLLDKLVSIKLNGNLLKWLASYLSNRTFTVKVTKNQSSTKMAQCGVPQGAVLSPILFGIYVNEIRSKLPMGVHCKQFADDIKLYSEIPKDSDPQNNKLKQAIDAICQ